MTSYRDAGQALWGDAGAYAYDTYDRLREAHYPELPAQLPIVIGLTAYGRCNGLTRYINPPRISIWSPLFQQGRRQIDDLLAHEMLHAWLHITGCDPDHDSRDWYDAINRLSPAILGRDIGARRGADRKSVRRPNPDWTPENGLPKTVVRKIRAEDAVQHSAVAHWPQAFRPGSYDWGPPIPCPSY